jgi:hypothetical protein
MKQIIGVVLILAGLYLVHNTLSGRYPNEEIASSARALAASHEREQNYDAANYYRSRANRAEDATDEQKTFGIVVSVALVLGGGSLVFRKK